MQRTFRLCALALGATLLAPIHANADRLPLGLNIGSGIFLQEIWQAGTPHLCVANSSGNEQTLVLSRWRSRVMPAEPCCAGEWMHIRPCATTPAPRRRIADRIPGWPVASESACCGPGRPGRRAHRHRRIRQFQRHQRDPSNTRQLDRNSRACGQGWQAARVDLLLTVGADGADAVSGRHPPGSPTPHAEGRSAPTPHRTSGQQLLIKGRTGQAATVPAYNSKSTCPP